MTSVHYNFDNTWLILHLIVNEPVIQLSCFCNLIQRGKEISSFLPLLTSVIALLPITSQKAARVAFKELSELVHP